MRLISHLSAAGLMVSQQRDPDRPIAMGWASKKQEALLSFALVGLISLPSVIWAITLLLVLGGV
jgi:hypothetical protein